MALESFLDSNSQSPMPIILEALTSHSSLENERDLDSILRMAQLDANFGSDVMNSTILGNSSTSRSAVGHEAAIAVTNLTLPTGAYLQSQGNTLMEPYISLPSYPMPFLGDNPVNGLYTDDTLSHLSRAREKESKKQQLENTTGSMDLHKRKVKTRQDSLPGRVKQDICTLIPGLKKPRIDVNQENVQRQQQEIIRELLLKELHDSNPQLKAIIKQYRQQNQLQQPILHLVPQHRGLHLQIPKQLSQQKIISNLQDQGNQREIFARLLDGGICSQRLKQYLYHLRNNRHENSISYWKKFVAEYYAPGSKKRWCFSKYENIELHTAGAFCPKSMETRCCQLCGSKSGKGLEATFGILPRLFKLKLESGMLDEIIFLDSPRACKVSCGVVLEYRKAIQESVYETFRVVHRGKVRIVLRHDLKILSWEFCVENHDEYLLRTLFTPQVNQMVQAAEKCQDIQNCASSKASSPDLRKVCDVFVSAGTQILRNMELPLVNDLGYPKRFIRCLQIAEVVDSMKDLMTFSHYTKMGPIECLNNYSQGSNPSNQMKGKQGMELFSCAHNQATFPEQAAPGFHANGCWMTENGVVSGSGSSDLTLVDLNRQLLKQNSSTSSARRKGHDSFITDHSNRALAFAQSFSSYVHNEAHPSGLQSSQSSENVEIPHQALAEKILREMAAGRRGKSVHDTFKKPNTEAALQSGQTCATGKEVHYGESRSNAATAQVNSANASRNLSFSKAVSHGNSSTVSQKVTVKAEPYSPEGLSEALLSSAAGFSYIENFGW